MSIFDFDATDIFNEDEEMLAEACKRKAKKEKELEDEMVEDELVEVKSEASDFFGFDTDEDEIFAESLSDLKRKMREKSADRKERKAQKAEARAQKERDFWDDMDKERDEEGVEEYSRSVQKVKERDLAKADARAQKARAKADAAKAKLQSESIEYFEFDEDEIFTESLSDLKRKMQEKSADRKERKAQKREEAAKANRDHWDNMDEEEMSEKEKRVREKDLAKTDARAQKARAKADAAKAKLQCEDAYFDMDEETEIFFESLEGDQLITEALLEDAGVTLTEDEVYELVSEQLLSERSIVRLDKQAKRSLAEKKAVIVIAKEQNDPLYKKLVKVYKQKRDIIEKLVDKYGSRAASRVRKNKQSAGSVLAKFIKKGDSKQSTDMPQK